MLKKTITYTDLNGEEQVEDFYFNLTKAELVQMEMSGPGNSLGRSLEDIGREKDGKKIIETFDYILKKAYGVRSPDGKRFLKNDEAFEAFKSSEPYSILFMELITVPGAASDFINGLMPADLPSDQPQPGAHVQTVQQVAPAPQVVSPSQVAFGNGQQ